MDINALPVLFDVLFSRLSLCGQEARRVFHGRGRCYLGLEQITVDWLGQGILHFALYKEQEESFYFALNEAIAHFCQQPLWQDIEGRSVILQHRDLNRTQVILGDIPEQINIIEHALYYKLNLNQTQNRGLFFDMRLGRLWVKEHAFSKRVLNLFSYTCGFSVAAIAGGAKSVVNLDMAKMALSRGRENHLINHHDIGKVTFLAHELFKSWGKVKKYGPYDLIIIDPPSFQKGSFVLTKDYAKILRRLPELMADDADILACVNSPKINEHFLIEQMQACAPQCEFIKRLDNPPEFEDIDLQCALKVMHFRHRAIYPQLT